MQACILINFFNDKCIFVGTQVVCIYEDYYTNGNYSAMMANLGLNVAFAFGSAGASLFMLASSFVTKDRTP
jgi:hypothetical protein